MNLGNVVVQSKSIKSITAAWNSEDEQYAFVLPEAATAAGSVGRVSDCQFRGCWFEPNWGRLILDIVSDGHSGWIPSDSLPSGICSFVSRVLAVLNHG